MGARWRSGLRLPPPVERARVRTVVVAVGAGGRGIVERVDQGSDRARARATAARHVARPYRQGRSRLFIVGGADRRQRGSVTRGATPESRSWLRAPTASSARI